MTRIGTLILLLAVVLSALAVAVTRHESRRAFVELTRAEKQRDELEIEFGRLQIEQSTWAETNRVEQLARARLGMEFPKPQDSQLVVR